jgi:cobalamin biosynthesis protein CobW
VHEGRALEGTFEYQLTSADLLVLNKIDLVPAAALPAIEARLREIEPEAPIVHCTHGEVEAAVLFPPDADRAERRPRTAPARDHGHEHFRAEILEVPKGIGERDLIERVRQEGALRAKGFVETAAGLRLVQGVAARVQLHPVSSVAAELLGRVVLIRKDDGRG